MNRALLEELSLVFSLEANNVGGDPHAWPPAPPLTDDRIIERERLRITAARIWYRACSTPGERLER